MKDIVSIGIDPGSRNGAASIIDRNLNILLLQKIPFFEVEVKSKKNSKLKLNKDTGIYEVSYKKKARVDFKNLRNLFKDYVNNKIIYTIEKVSTRPGEGESSSFIFGESFGIFKGLYSYLNPINYYEPTPQSWKSELGLSSDKSLSIFLANDIFQDSLSKNNIKLKYVTKHADLAESLLLAYYGLIKYVEKGK